jgi:ribokinase
MVDTTDPAAAAQAARAARNAGVPTVVDADAATAETEPLMREIDVAIVARSFLDQMFPGQSAGEGLRRLVEAHRPAVAVVTLGAEGSLARSEEGEIFTPALPVEVRDTTGAGDAFRAGFVYAWLAAPDRPDLAWILKWATTTAGLSCQALGAQTGLPTRGEVERRL